jgi:long-chain acyl-CoA synthetase
LAKASEKATSAAKDDKKPAAKKPAAAKKAPAKAAATEQPKAPAKAKASAAKSATASGATAKVASGKAAADAAAPAATAKKPATKKAPAKATAAPKVDAAPETVAAVPAQKKPAAKKAPAKGAAAPKVDAAPETVAPAPAPKKPAAKKSTAASKPKAPAKPKAASAAAAAAPGATTASSAPAAKAAPKGDKPWLANYPEGIPGEIGSLEYQSLGDLMVDACRKFSSKPAFTSMGKSLSFADLEKQSAAFAAYLQSKGLAKGARVAIMMPNVLQYPVTMMAVLRAGYTVVNVNPLYTPRELEHQLNDSGAEAIIILENFAATLQAVIGRTKIKHVVVASMGDRLGLKGFVVNLVVRRVKKMVPAWSLPGHVAFNDALKQGASKTFRKIDVGQEDIAFLQYTGGTTGVSKGATLTHKNVLANVAQNALWVEAAYKKKKKPADVVYICALPLYHIYALTVNALMGMQQGAQNLLIANPRDIPAFVKELKKTPFHVFPGLNTLFNALLNNADFQKLDFKPLLLTFGGGMAVQRPVADRWKQLTGITIAEGYGLSETSPVATANRFDADEFTGTIGLPLPSTEVAIRDEEGKDVPLGEVGEICIRGPQVMSGYWNRPDETAKVMTPDGFFKSGDMGFMDENGFVKIVDRKKDMILVSGFNVYPNEIEEVVAEHPGVLEVAAVGVPDEHSGEVPKLFIVKKDEKLTEKEIIDFTRDKLTGYKRPKHVEFRTELPKTNVGKILRRELR